MTKRPVWLQTNKRMIGCKALLIEDSTANPKTAIGDVMAVLLGEGLAFAGHADWQVGDWTSLMVLAYVPTSHAQTKYCGRLVHIQQQLAAAQNCLTTRNAAIGRIVLGTLKDIGDLQEKLEPVSDGQKVCQV